MGIDGLHSNFSEVNDSAATTFKESRAKFLEKKFQFLWSDINDQKHMVTVDNRKGGTVHIFYH